jgi:prolipoprotein diacylglyceryltransferase
MEQIAFIIDDRLVYWSSLMVALSGAIAVCLFVWLYTRETGNWQAAGWMLVLGCPLSVFLSRLIHWYCRYSSYSSFQTAITDYSVGGYALAGVFAGCLLIACLLRLTRRVDSLGQLLDCACIAGAAGIAAGRLSCFFSSDDQGMLLVNFTRLPIANCVVNPITGQEEYRLATFMLQALVAGFLFIVLLHYYVVRCRKSATYRHGDVFWIFMIIYCASQAVLDSTRYDSLFLRSNGFVSLVQILCLVVLVVIMTVFSLRLVKALGWNPGFLLLWIPALALLGGAGYMEYFVQRHGNQAAFGYTIMSLCLASYVLLAMAIRWIANRFRHQHTFWNPAE